MLIELLCLQISFISLFVQLPPYNETVSCGIKSTGKFHHGKKSTSVLFKLKGCDTLLRFTTTSL